MRQITAAVSVNASLDQLIMMRGSMLAPGIPIAISMVRKIRRTQQAQISAEPV